MFTNETLGGWNCKYDPKIDYGSGLDPLALGRPFSALSDGGVGVEQMRIYGAVSVEAQLQSRRYQTSKAEPITVDLQLNHTSVYPVD